MSIRKRRGPSAEPLSLDPTIEQALRDHLGVPNARLDRVGGRRSKGVVIDFVDADLGDTEPARLVAKRYLAEAPNPRSKRPGLGLVDDRAVKPTTEWDGLVRLREQLPDASVEPVLNIADEQLLVMERFTGDSVRATMFGDPATATAQVRVAAELLATLHQLDGGAPLRATGAEVDATGVALIDYTASLLRPLGVDRIRGWWRDQPDTDPALGLGHNDCAPRNFVTDVDGRVAIIDCLARHRMPVFEDVATFTTSVRILMRAQWARRPQVARRGSQFATAFADAYLQSTTLASTDLPRFEALVLLDRLASLALRSRTPGTVAQTGLVLDELRRVTKRTPS